MPRRFYLPDQQKRQPKRPDFAFPRPSRRAVRYGAVGILAAAVLVTAWLAVRHVERPSATVTLPRSDARIPVATTTTNPLPAALPIKLADSVAAVEPAAPPSRRDTSRQLIPLHPVRVQVLNGCGVKGLAKLISPVLRAKGFDVRETRNAAHFRHHRTLIIDRGTAGLGRIMADSLGLDSSRLTVEAARDLVDIDVTLIVGADYKLLPLAAHRSEQE